MPTIDRKDRDKEHDRERAVMQTGETGGTGAETSISVDETNRLRISLGLAPLAIKSKQEIAEEREQAEKNRANAIEAAEAEELRQELAKRKHKRQLNARVEGKSLGEELLGDEKKRLNRLLHGLNEVGRRKIKNKLILN